MIKFGKILKFQSSESGYTIMEGLVAMIMVSFLMSAVAPIIAFSVGTRVQARMIELAAQAARSYIDAVRKGQLNPPNGFADDTELTADALEECRQINEDNELQYCQPQLIVNTSGEFYCVDNNDDNKCTPDSLTDMMVYGAINLTNTRNDYKNQIEEATSEQKQQLGYRLQVRVYRAKAFLNGVTLSNKGVPFTVNNSGLATRDGEKERPLFVTETEIAPTQNLFQNYKNRIEQ
ncbi:MAG: hormogonium polysaccharide secretion pseudopilin HpsB [Trichodesmium sp. MAG_R04]|nr:hormogonium polysaccharide secretion pseudopilin HpsB [Trichodesmium sp. MAG_R04]